MYESVWEMMCVGGGRVWQKQGQVNCANLPEEGGNEPPRSYVL